MLTGAGVKRAVFLDRDGVINRLMLDRGPRETPRTVADVALLPGVVEGLQQLKAAEFLLLVVTNQPNIAKGKTTWEDDAAITQRIHDLLGSEAALDGVYACQHHPDAAQVAVPELLKVCDCRKPAPGLIRQGLIDFELDLSACWLVGDADTD
ncbi:MAG: HAD-IIIA family hydrolase, partial [Patescibacteria group bacterium]